MVDPPSTQLVLPVLRNADHALYQVPNNIQADAVVLIRPQQLQAMSSDELRRYVKKYVLGKSVRKGKLLGFRAADEPASAVVAADPALLTPRASYRLVVEHHSDSLPELLAHSPSACRRSGGAIPRCLASQ